MATRHAPNEALAILADQASTQLPRSMVCALFEIGVREESDADAVERAVIELAQLMLSQGEIH